MRHKQIWKRLSLSVWNNSHKKQIREIPNLNSIWEFGMGKGMVSHKAMKKQSTWCVKLQNKGMLPHKIN